jgi:hypothetical protein
MGMGEQAAPTIAEDLPMLERERVETWLRRSGGGPSLVRLVLPEEVTIELAQVGSLVLRPRCFDFETGALTDLATSCEVFSIDAVAGGALLVEHSFARHLLNAMVGAPGSLASRPLSRVERGMVAGLAAVSLAKLGLPLGVRAAAERHLFPMEDALCIQVWAHLCGMDGHAWLCAAATALGRAHHPPGIVEMLSPLSVELARTQLTMAEALGARPRDLVVFDDWPACQAAASLPVDLCCRGRRLHVRLDCDGRVRMDDAMAATRRIRSPRTPLVQAGFVEITAELARTASRSDGVLLRIGDSDWAEGSLAAHEEHLAVRITRILTRTGAG